jgi:hypothetical protein
MTILPLTYLGGTEWFTHLAGGDCIIDTGENWVKQTMRNRAEILTANGVAPLTVPVHGGNAHGGNGGAKIRIRDIRIDDSKRWRHTHWQSIVSAYRNSPYFDHYEDRFAPVYERRFDFLIDLNLELLDILIRAMGLAGAFTISEDYIAPSPDDLDLRGKKALRRPPPTASAIPAQNIVFEEYTQVFYDRMPFVPGLSIVDLLFCEGPSAGDFISAVDRNRR